MPLTSRFLQVAESLYVPSMGTEHVAMLLYSLTSMLRPRSVLEIGAGYTTLFLAQALHDATQEAAADRGASTGRASVLCSQPAAEYSPQLFVMDNLQHPLTSAGGVGSALDRLGLGPLVTVLSTGFEGASGRLPDAALPLDLVWFDCGAASAGGVRFLNEYWPLLNPLGGVLVMHSLEVALPSRAGGVKVASPLLNELRKRQADAGRNRVFEIMALSEPHKRRQGDVVIMRKPGPLGQIRHPDFAEDASRFTGKTMGVLEPLQ